MTAETDADGHVGRFAVEDDGTGFGLAIVREVVQAHDWTISATDGDSGGARFGVETGPVRAELGEEAAVESKPTSTAPTKRGR